MIGIDTVVESRAAADAAARAEWGTANSDLAAAADADEEEEEEGSGGPGSPEAAGSALPQMLLSRRGRRGRAGGGVVGMKEGTGWRRLATAGVYLRLGWTVRPSEL